MLPHGIDRGSAVSKLKYYNFFECMLEINSIQWYYLLTLTNFEVARKRKCLYRE